MCVNLPASTEALYRRGVRDVEHRVRRDELDAAVRQYVAHGAGQLASAPRDPNLHRQTRVRRTPLSAARTVRLMPASVTARQDSTARQRPAATIEPGKG